jgi:O-antigen/teichoic acid export membrane protein
MPVDRASLKTLILRGSAWMFVGHGSAQFLRLLKSLILTRLLFPEAFGVMSLVWAVMIGLEMLSDVGLRSSIIRENRGDDPEFLNTAWTMQVIRGVLLWACACLLAQPVAAFYAAPELAHLIPVAGLTAVIAGFTSTATHTSFRRMEYGRLTLLTFSNEVVGFVSVVVWALLYPTVWALVGGALIGRLFYVLCSHAWLPGIRNRFRWQPSSLRMLIGFGKWIFLSSAVGFLSMQGDRMLLGRYLDLTQLGVYSIAIMLSGAVYALVIKINHGVLYPAYGSVVREEPQRLPVLFYRARLGIDVLLIIPIAGLMILGDWVVGVLYDERYREAGWMLQALCVRLLMACVLTNTETCLFALGHPQYAFVQSVCRAIWIFVGIPVGWSMMGITGAVWAVALSEVPVIVVLWAGLIRHQVFSLLSELRSVFFAGFGAVLGLGLLRLLP